jgi:acyl carrier protein phosphodiesterase
MSILLFTTHFRKSNQHVVGTLLGSMNFKSSKEYNLDPIVLDGLKSYRAMSSFLVEHPVFKQSLSQLSRRLKDSDVAARILMDHFFAKQWEQSDREGYTSYILHFYQKLVEYQNVTPITIRRLVPQIMSEGVFSNLHTVGGYHRMVNFLIANNKVSCMVGANLIDLQENYLLLSHNFDIIYEDFKNMKWDDSAFMEVELLQKAC